MKYVGKVFMQGLVITLPLVLTFVILRWLGRILEGLMDPVFETVYPPAVDIPGLGILLSLMFVFIVGALVHLWFVRVLFERFEGVLGMIPLVKSVYGSFRDILRFVTGTGSRDFQRVVLVKPGGDDGPRLVGLVTRSDFSDWSRGPNTDNALAVYTPLSYQFGGYTLIVSEDRVEDLDLTLEEGLRFALTAGVKSSDRKPDGINDPVED